MKKFFMALCAAALVGVSTPVSAVNEQAPDNLYVWGTVEEIGEHQIHIQNSSDQYNDVVLNVTDTTIVIDAMTGKKVDFEELEENEKIAAFVSPVMTRSLPPITNAFVIVTNIPEDAGVPKYYRVGEILSNENDELRVLDTNGSLIVTMNKETELFAYDSNDSVALNDIVVGKELMVWHGPVALSYPGQTFAQKVMVFNEKQNGWVKVADDWFYYLNGTMCKNQWVASTSTRWYYVGEDGKMVTNTVIDGCQIDEKGIYQK